MKNNTSETSRPEKAFCLSLLCLLAFMLLTTSATARKDSNELWPDGTQIDKWFDDTSKKNIDDLGRKYVITDYGIVNDSTLLQTNAIQHVIDLASNNGGGVVVIPKGTFLSGALFFKPNTHLWLLEEARLKAIDDVKHYPVLDTRIEGETRKYFSAFINADGVDGFTIGGNGTIDGNGRRFWEEFRARRTFNPQCTNVDCMRYRLVYISNSSNVTVQDVRLINSPFWTNHLYRCNHVRYLGCYIYSPTDGIEVYGKKYGAPSTDAIDIDVCHDVLVDRCYMSVNDDAVVLKGGKGTWADKKPENGPNRNIIIQNCQYGIVHGCLTVGSESLHSHNIILRDIEFHNAYRVLWLKMRPDTPQHYEHIRIERLHGTCRSFLVVRPWTQFYKPEERLDMPVSSCNDITIKDIDADCENFFDVGLSDKYSLSRFNFISCDIRDKHNAFTPEIINNATVKNVKIKATK